MFTTLTAVKYYKGYILSYALMDSNSVRCRRRRQVLVDQRQC